MNYKEYLSFWNKLNKEEKVLLENNITKKTYKNGHIIYHDSKDCLGLIIVIKGKIRAFIENEDGRQITLYRLYEYDMCLFSAACIMKSIEFEINLEIEEDTEVYIIPAIYYHKLMENSVTISNYTSELMTDRFNNVMWVLNQILYKKLDTRLAAFLIEECNLENTKELTLTHEKIANNLGTAREVVSRMLKYFEGENLIKITRGKIEILNYAKLNEIASDSLK